MSNQSRNCPHAGIEHVRRFVAYAKFCVNSECYYPPLRAYRYMVALALYSKCLTVAEATMVLVQAGFSDEAFGMTRTLVDVFITLRYISNKDPEDRAQRYWRFLAKDIEAWNNVIKDFWPHNVQTISPRTLSTAATYPHPHRWSGKSVREMALEPDTYEVNPATGEPVVHDFAYKVVYRWTSHYVHPTIGALENHVVQAGRDNFVINSGHLRDMRNIAVYNIACYVVHTMICFYRCMGDPQPHRVGMWGDALLKHLTRRHP